LGVGFLPSDLRVGVKEFVRMLLPFTLRAWLRDRPLAPSASLLERSLEQASLAWFLFLLRFSTRGFDRERLFDTERDRD
jgi:hypothetical protein